MRPLRFLAASLMLPPLCAARAAAQTDYYNTDVGRPTQVQDAYAIERRAVELQVGPLRVERAGGGLYVWGLEPGVAVGLLPRTQVELGVPLAFADAGVAGSVAGLAGLELSVLHNLNAETAIPALAVGADVLLPVGALAPDAAYPSVEAVATRTLTWARFHLDGRYTFGDASFDAGHVVVADLSRWMVGAAVDHTFPLRSLLVTGEVVARRPLEVGGDVRWSSGAGLRYQLGPRVSGDAGFGYRFARAVEGWYVTAGAALSVGLPWRAR